jgi:3-oxoacyl-[acyl-carrier protein] reductase
VGALDGQGALVTGGSRGIGRAIVKRLAADGAAANPGETFDGTVARTALPRLGQPGDIAAVVAFLAGPDSGWISGQNLAADGGLLPWPP